MKFAEIPSIYPQLLELRKSKDAKFKQNSYWNPSMTLRYYQVIGALHMLLLNRMVLGDSTGLGKTIQAIATYTFLLESIPNLKLLIVCPKSATTQWQEEFAKFSIGITTRVLSNEYNKLTGYKARLAQYQEFKENVLIMGYAIILDEYEKIKEILGPRFMVVFDECVAFKSRTTKTHIASKEIAEAAERAYGMSATIIKNGLEEVWGIYDVIVPGLFGKITPFKKMYCQEKMLKIRVGGKTRMIPKVIGYKNLDKFKQAIDPYFLIRKKEEVAEELPKLISKKIILEMTPEQKDAYRQALLGIVYEEKVKRQYYEVADKVRTLAVPDKKTIELYESLKEKYDKFTTTEGKQRGKLAALTYCQMISNGPQLVNMQGESSKEEEFVRLMTEELLTEKVLLFTRFKSGIPYLEVICEKKGISYAKITGDCSDKERTDARHKFMTDPNCRLLFITTAGAASLNLQAASVIIFYDTPWSFGDLAQVIGRAQRIGSLQEHVLLIHLINKSSIDMRVMNRVSSKKGLSDKIIGDTAVGALDFTQNENSAVNDLFEDLLKDAGDL